LRFGLNEIYGGCFSAVGWGKGREVDRGTVVYRIYSVEKVERQRREQSSMRRISNYICYVEEQNGYVLPPAVESEYNLLSNITPPERERKPFFSLTYVLFHIHC